MLKEAVKRMSPRKTHYRIPDWKIREFKIRSKKIIFGPYFCPKCKKENLKVRVNKNKKEANALCDCGLEHLFKFIPSYDPVDYYNKFVDQFTPAVGL